jgi:predicted SprT family Zn-dependent metalloprotease
METFDKLLKTAELAESLMRQFDVSGWKFEFDHAKMRCGLCSYRRKTISLSKHYVMLNSWAEIEDTIRHEIAHALTPADKGHGEAWKRMAVKCGAKPERCTSNAVSVPGRYYGICKDCNGRFERYRSLHARQLDRMVHSQCQRKANQGGIVWYHSNGEQVRHSTPRTNREIAAERERLEQADIVAMWNRLNAVEENLK